MGRTRSGVLGIVFLVGASALSWAIPHGAAARDLRAAPDEAAYETFLLQQALSQFDAVAGSLSTLAFEPCAAAQDGNPRPRLLQPGNTVRADDVILVTHGTYHWDSDGVVAPAVNSWVGAAKSRGAAAVYLMHSLAPDAVGEYYGKHRPDGLYESLLGEHQLRIRARRIFFTGGYFTYCSAESMRDAVLYSDVPGEPPPRLIFPMAAIFQYDAGGTPQEAEGSEVVSLQARMKNASDPEFMQYLRDWYFPAGSVGMNKRDDRQASLADYTFTIYRDGAPIGTIGHGAKARDMEFLSK